MKPRPLMSFLPAAMAALLALGCGALVPSTIAATTGSTGSGSPTAVENNQPTLGIRWLINVSGGVYPSRDIAISTDAYLLGEIRALPSEFDGNPPNGWVACEGQTLQVLQNASLYSLLGTTFGGTGGINGNFKLPDLRGRVPVGIGQGPGLANVTLGQVLGSEGHTLTSGNLPAHTHTITGGSTGSTGSGTPLANAQPGLGLNMVLQTQGIYQSMGWVRILPYDINLGQKCDGTLLSIAQNATLFGKLGTTFGGNGTSTFGVPDLRGRTLVGVGEGPGLTAREIGDAFGTESITLSSGQIPAHTHSYSGGTTGSSGSGQSHSTVQPSLALHAVCAPYGIFNQFPGVGSDGLAAVGEIRFQATTSMAGIWADWLVCDGASYDAMANDFFYYNLSIYYGSAFGGEMEVTLTVPDLRGRAAANRGSGTGLTTRFVGDAWGAQNVTVQTANLPAHTHTVPDTGAPEIAVEQPLATNIPDGGSKGFGSVNLGSTADLVFTIKNTGTADLTGLTITKDGTDASMFSVTVNPTAPVAGPSGTTTFTVRFAPSGGAGAKSAAIHIANNDADENPFDISLTGTAVSPNTPPTVAATSSTVTVNEGGAASNSGTFSDAQGNPTVTLSASVGTITPNTGAGTWSWSLSTTDGPDQTQTVTITANDGVAPAVQTTFSLVVNNVAPTAIGQTGVGAVSTPEDVAVPITLASSDPGADTRTYSIVTGPSPSAGTLGPVSGNSVTFTPASNYSGPASFTFKATDSDGADSAPATVEINVSAVNDPPEAGADGLARLNNTKIAKILKTSLLANDRDAEGDPLTVAGVGGAQPAGSTVVIAGSFVVYTAPAINAGNGSFTYTLSDGPGGHSVVVTVPVTEVSSIPSGAGPNAASITPSGSDFILTFIGVPGNTYRVQYTTSVGPPYTWSEFSPLAVYTAPGSGVFSHTDFNPPGPSRFYRAIPHP